MYPNIKRMLTSIIIFWSVYLLFSINNTSYSKVQLHVFVVYSTGSVLATSSIATYLKAMFSSSF